MEKVEGYALENKNGDYLYFEQVSNTELQTHASKSSTVAELDETPESAAFVAIDMINGSGKWKYLYLKDDKPVSVAKITILSHAETVKDLSDIR